VPKAIDSKTNSKIARGKVQPISVTRTTFELLLAVRIRRVHLALNKSAALRYRYELGLTVSEWRSVIFVGIRGPMTIGALSDLLEVDRSLVSRLVDTLSTKRILKRGKETVDLRRSLVTLTKAGEAVFKRIGEASLERDAEIISSLSELERRYLESALLKIEDLSKAWIEDAERVSKGQADKSDGSQPSERAGRV
jgi:DNA-binding MarR family transcriptional regulator